MYDEERINTLRGKNLVEQLTKDEILEIFTAFDEVTSELEGVSFERDDYESESAGLSEEVDALESEVDDLKTQVSELEDRIDELNEENGKS